jgi:hypothetical protein
MCAIPYVNNFMRIVEVKKYRLEYIENFHAHNQCQITKEKIQTARAVVYCKFQMEENLARGLSGKPEGRPREE